MAIPHESFIQNDTPQENEYSVYTEKQRVLSITIESLRSYFVSENGKAKTIQDIARLESRAIKSILENITTIFKILLDFEQTEGLTIHANRNEGFIDITRDISQYMSISQTIILIFNNIQTLPPHKRIDYVESTKISHILFDYFFGCLSIGKGTLYLQSEVSEGMVLKVQHSFDPFDVPRREYDLKILIEENVPLTTELKALKGKVSSYDTLQKLSNEEATKISKLLNKTLGSCRDFMRLYKQRVSDQDSFAEVRDIFTHILEYKSKFDTYILSKEIDQFDAQLQSQYKVFFEKQFDYSVYNKTLERAINVLKGTQYKRV